MKIPGLGASALPSGPLPTGPASGRFMGMVAQLLVPTPGPAPEATAPVRPPTGSPVGPTLWGDAPPSEEDLRDDTALAPIQPVLLPVTVTAPKPQAPAGVSEGPPRADLPSSSTSSVVPDPSTPTVAPPASTAPDTALEVGDPGASPPSVTPSGSPPLVYAPAVQKPPEVSAPAPAVTAIPPEITADAALRGAELPFEEPSEPDDETEAPRTDDAPRAEIRLADAPAPTERRVAPERDVPRLDLPSDELLPPESARDDIRIRIDADLSVHLLRHGNTVDVRLTGNPDAVAPLLGIGPELDASLAGGGFDLGHFGSGDEPRSRPDTAPDAVRTRTVQRVWRAGRYA